MLLSNYLEAAEQEVPRGMAFAKKKVVLDFLSKWRSPDQSGRREEMLSAATWMHRMADELTERANLSNEAGLVLRDEAAREDAERKELARKEAERARRTRKG